MSKTVCFQINPETFEVKKLDSCPSFEERKQDFIVSVDEKGFFYCNQEGKERHSGHGFPIGIVKEEEIVPFLKNYEEERKRRHEELRTKEAEYKILKPKYKKLVSELVKTIKKELKLYRPLQDIKKSETKYICPVCGKPLSIETEHYRKDQDGNFSIFCTSKCKINILLDEDHYMELNFHYNLEKAKVVDPIWK